MFFSKSHTYWLFIALFTLTAAKDLTVDANLASANGTAYPSLNEALQALLSGQNLTEATNTITLLESCLNVTQNFSGTKIGPAGMSGGSISIIYSGAIPSTIDTEDACNQLPALVLTEYSYINVEYLTSFSISGVDIYYFGATSLNSIYAVETVSFSSMCFYNYESSFSLQEGDYNYFIMSQITTFSMTNGFYYFDGIKGLIISEANQVTIDSMAIMIATFVDAERAAFNITNYESYPTTVSVSNISIGCGDIQYSIFLHVPNIFWHSNTTSVSISSLTMPNCQFSPGSLNPQYIVHVTNTSNFEVKNVTSSNLSIGSAENQNFFYISSVSKTILSDFSIIQPVWIRSFVYISDEEPGNYYPMSLSLSGFSVVGLGLVGGSSTDHLFNILFNNYTNYGSISFQNVYIEGCWLVSSPSITFQILSSSTNSSLSNPVKYFTINNMILSGNWLGTDAFIYFYFSSQTSNFDNDTLDKLPYIRTTEVVRLEISNLNSSNNSIDSTAIIQAEGVLTYITDSVIEGDTYSDGGSFYLSNEIVSTLLMKNTSFSGITVTYNSPLISTSAVSYGDTSLFDGTWNALYDPGFFISMGDCINSLPCGSYIETRPLIIYICSFTNITLTSNSSLILSNNPEIVIQNNYFSQLSVVSSIPIDGPDGSELFTLGNYTLNLPLAVGVDLEILFGPQEMGVQFLFLQPFSAVEESLFQDYPDLHEVYNNARANITPYATMQNLFFIVVQDNTFDSISAPNTDTLISFANFQLSNGSVAALNNAFSNITSDNSASIFSQTTYPRGIYVNNSLDEGALITFFYFNSTPLQDILLSLNALINSNDSMFYKIESDECDQITFQGNFVSDLQIAATLIDITCTVIDTSISFQNVTFQNIDLTFNPGGPLVTSLNLVSIMSQDPASSGTIILFQDCSFSNLIILNHQYFSQGLIQSSILNVMTLVDELQFENVIFDSITASPKGSIIISTTPVVGFSNTNLTNIEFGSPNGAIFLLLQNLLIQKCRFENNSGLNSDGAGLIQAVNSDPENTMLTIAIQNSAFKNNTAPYGTIVYIQDTPIQFSLSDTKIINNQVTESGGLFRFLDIFSSAIEINNSNFTQSEGYNASYPQLNIFSLEKTGNNVSIILSNSNINVSGTIYGVFLSIVSLQPVALTASQVSYSAGFNVTSPQFGFLDADNLQAIITKFQASDISLDQTPIFIINCDTAGKQSYTWNLIVTESQFTGSDSQLNEAIFLINSDGYIMTALNNLSLVITDTEFNNIKWVASTSNTASGGIIQSSTPLIGRTTPSSDFAVTLQNCVFSQLSGEGSLIFGTVESMFDSVMLIENSAFTVLTPSEVGALINPSITTLSTFTSQLNKGTLRNESYKIIGSNFSNIMGQMGCVMYWESDVRGISITIEDSIITNVGCSQDGGVFYIKYSMTDSTFTNLTSTNLTEEHKVIINSRSTFYQNISASNGGISYISGEDRLFQITFEENTIEGVNAAQSGGVIQIFSLNSTSTAITSRRLEDSSTQPTTGSLMMTLNNFTIVSASNGGIIYEATTSGTMSITLDSNTFQSISATSRGGVLYILEPTLTVSNNTFGRVSARYAGNLVYSISDNVDLSNLNASNNSISSVSTAALFSLAPTNLEVKFTSLTDGSTIQLENADVLPYIPTVRNITSYSLSQYQIDLTLVYKGQLGYQVVVDESSTMQVTLNFTQRDNSSLIYSGSDCSNSICSILPNTIVLRGLAGDVVTVNATYTSNQYNINQQFNISLRSCIPGELNSTNGLECTYCDANTYSLSINDTKCHDCPIGATCAGGASIFIDPGYYRSNASQTNLTMVNCNDTETRCLGGFENTCEQAFTGPVCLQCNLEDNYVSAGKLGKCNICYDKKTLMIYTVLLLLASIGYQVFMFYITYKENKKTHEDYQATSTAGIQLKPGHFIMIFTKFCQITSILVSLDSEATDFLLGITNTIGNSNTQATSSLQCLYHLVTPNSLDGFEFQILLYVLSPLAKLLIAIIIEVIRSIIWRDKKGQRTRNLLIRIGSVAVVLILMEQPGIVGILCEYLSCSRLDPNVDEYYIKVNSNVQCYTDKYNFFSWVFVIPSLVFWGLIVPVTIFAILYKNRERLYESEVISIVLGNFYNANSQKVYYWGVIMMLLKLTLYVLNAVLNASDTLKGLIFMMIIHAYFYLLRKNSPYTNIRLIFAEKCCCIAYMVLLTFQFVSASTENSTLQYFCEVFIVGSIIIAGIYILANFGILFIAKGSEIMKKIKDKKRTAAILTETRQALELYHKSLGPGRIDSHYRRKAISLDLPLRLRNTEDFEKELESAQQKRIQKKINKKKSYFRGTLETLFSGGNISEQPFVRRSERGTTSASQIESAGKSPTSLHSAVIEIKDSLPTSSHRQIELTKFNTEEYCLSENPITLKTDNQQFKTPSSPIDLKESEDSPSYHPKKSRFNDPYFININTNKQPE